MRIYPRHFFKLIFLTLAFIPMHLFAQDNPKASSMANPMVQVFLLIIGILAICIILLARVLAGAAMFKVKQFKEKQAKPSDTIVRSSLIIGGLLFSSYVFADEPVQKVVSDSIGGMGSATFYMLLSVVIVELILLLALLYNLKFLLREEKIRIQTALEDDLQVTPNKWLILWDKINSFRPVKEEGLIDLGHDYDGIRELDNRLPPWWLYGFFVCILFAVIYLYRFEVAHTGPSSIEEYNIAMQKGQEEKEAYLKSAANKVDENSVKMLTDEADLAGGRAIFTTVCAACHSADGGGLVGPNLTDQYWLHGGSLKDIFKTIKYGWQEKGMKSWKDDYTPVQIAQLASYVKSLSGTKPLKAKDPQGELYEEQKITADPAVSKKDSLPLIGAVK